MGPPMTPPIDVPMQDESTMKARGSCWSSGSYRSAMRPRVTLPPAVESPPWKMAHKKVSSEPHAIGKRRRLRQKKKTYQ